MHEDFVFPFEKDELLSAAWSRDFLRFEPGLVGPECDFNYLLNQAEAHTYFKNYFIQKQNVEKSFMKMLLNQHKIACLGYNGDRKYKIKGFFITPEEGKNGWCVRDSFAGNNRFMLSKKNIDHPSTDIIYIKHDSFSTFLLEEEDIKNRLIWIDFRFVIPDQVTLKIPICLKVENSRQRIYRKILFLRQGSFYCEHAKADEYLELERLVCINFAELYNKLHKCDFSIPIDNLLPLLSNYYHSFINWMPFAHVNNSLVLGQINVLLRLCGFKSVPHGKIDMSALITSTKVFFQIFREHILKYQI
jgi:hypothetical protein